MQDEQIPEALNAHWRASAAGDTNAEHDIYADGAICDYPQSGERILGRKNLQALRSHHPGKPSGFQVRRITGSGALWVTEYMINYEGKLAFTVAGRYSDRSFGTIDNSDPVSHTFQGFDGFLVVDTRIHYQMDDNWSIAAGIDNINNDKYFLFHPFPQRTFVMEIHYAQ